MLSIYGNSIDISCVCKRWFTNISVTEISLWIQGYLIINSIPISTSNYCLFISYETFLHLSLISSVLWYSIDTDGVSKQSKNWKGVSEISLWIQDYFTQCTKHTSNEHNVNSQSILHIFNQKVYTNSRINNGYDNQRYSLNLSKQDKG